VISDKQANIVNAVKAFNPTIPHVYCQYHFLHHIVEPIASKDSHLKTTFKKAVGRLSIVVNSNKADSNELYDAFLPISEELKCGISTRGDYFEIFPGVECHANLTYVVEKLTPFQSYDLPAKISRSLNSLIDALNKVLSRTEPLRDEILSLISEFKEIKKIFGKRANRSKYVKKLVEKWVYKLQNRLKRRDLAYDPSEIKWQYPSFKLACEEIWQQ
jgi:hypothetical protein